MAVRSSLNPAAGYFGEYKPQAKNSKPFRHTISTTFNLFFKIFRNRRI